MNVLAIDTSTSACSAALLTASGTIERCQLTVRGHAELILSMSKTLLAEAGMSLTQLDALAFGRGPGAFTGLRIAAAVVQGLAFGIDRPVVPVSDLLALAARTSHHFHRKRILVCMDARMNQIYWCAYDVNYSNDLSACMPESLDAPNSVKLPDCGGWFGAGSGFEAYQSILVENLGRALEGYDAKLMPLAKDIAILASKLFSKGQIVCPDKALPVYLRDRVAWSKPEL